MEMLVMKVVDWRLGCLTAASFLDQLLCDALSGALFHLQQQPGDYLSTARQLAAKLVSHTMPGLLMPAPHQSHSNLVHQAVNCICAASVHACTSSRYNWAVVAPPVVCIVVAMVESSTALPLAEPCQDMHDALLDVLSHVMQ